MRWSSDDQIRISYISHYHRSWRNKVFFSSWSLFVPLAGLLQHGLSSAGCLQCTASPVSAPAVCDVQKHPLASCFPRNPRDGSAAETGGCTPVHGFLHTRLCNMQWVLSSTPPSGWFSPEGRLPPSSNGTAASQQIPNELWLSREEGLFLGCPFSALGRETSPCFFYSYIL